jgi:hypothetical protein
MRAARLNCAVNYYQLVANSRPITAIEQEFGGPEWRAFSAPAQAMRGLMAARNPFPAPFGSVN